MIYCFDFDGTLCSQEKDYSKTEPYQGRIEKVNKLYTEGHRILLYTARGSTTRIDWREITEKQLQEWGVKYHELILDKPEADLFIDDRGVNADVFFDR